MLTKRRSWRQPQTNRHIVRVAVSSCVGCVETDSAFAQGGCGTMAGGSIRDELNEEDSLSLEAAEDRETHGCQRPSDFSSADTAAPHVAFIFAEVHSVLSVWVTPDRRRTMAIALSATARLDGGHRGRELDFRGFFLRRWQRPIMQADAASRAATRDGDLCAECRSPDTSPMVRHRHGDGIIDSSADPGCPGRGGLGAPLGNHTPTLANRVAPHCRPAGSAKPRQTAAWPAPLTR